MKCHIFRMTRTNEITQEKNRERERERENTFVFEENLMRDV